MDASSIWTIGHSNHPFERFAELLRGERIAVVVDVRSHPYSRFAPHFNREQVAFALQSAGARYLFQGDELGGRPIDDRHLDEDGHALYEEMAREPDFQAAVQRLIDDSKQHRIALMCSEGRPDECHRRLLVGKALADRGVSLCHILPNGEVAVESLITLGAVAGQPRLFEEGIQTWRSTRSVSRRRRLSTSSAG